MLTTRFCRSIQSALFFTLLLGGCSGGGSGSATTTGTGTLPGAPPPPIGLVSGASGFSTSCAGVPNPGMLYANSEVEPHIAVNPTNPNNLLGTWQQDCWSNGASQGIAVGVSFDAGATWATRAVPVSRCGGGNVLTAATSSAPAIRGQRSRRTALPTNSRLVSAALNFKQAQARRCWSVAQPTAVAHGPTRSHSFATAHNFSTTKTPSPPTQPIRSMFKRCGIA